VARCVRGTTSKKLPTPTTMITSADAYSLKLRGCKIFPNISFSKLITGIVIDELPGAEHSIDSMHLFNSTCTSYIE